MVNWFLQFWQVADTEPCECAEDTEPCECVRVSIMLGDFRLVALFTIYYLRPVGGVRGLEFIRASVGMAVSRPFAHALPFPEFKRCFIFHSHFVPAIGA